MSVHGGVVRDDRAWPRWAGAFSVAVVLVALVAGAWAVAAAAGRPVDLALVTVTLVVTLGLSVWLFRQSFVALVGGRRQPGWSVPVQLAFIVAGFVCFGVDARLGTAVFAGLFAGMFVTNLWAMRHARGNRAAVDAAEAEAEQARARTHGVAGGQPGRDSRPAVDLGGVLDGAWRDVRQRWVAWLVAAAAVIGAVVLLTDSSLARFMVPFLAGAALVWVTRAVALVWRARRDFRLARTPPERAWVVLLDDPTPRMIRPLLGVWSEEPVVRGGVFPKPDLVFRCDDHLDDLLSRQGAVEVHEAWVDTSGRGMRGARWVTADAGVALPHRRAFLGRAFFSSFTRSERPGPARPLESARPEPHAPRDPSAPHPGGPRLVTRVLWRALALAGIALVSVVLE
jgi:hypothetical protein